MQLKHFMSAAMPFGKTEGFFGFLAPLYTARLLQKLLALQSNCLPGGVGDLCDALVCSACLGCSAAA